MCIINKLLKINNRLNSYKVMKIRINNLRLTVNKSS